MWQISTWIFHKYYGNWQEKKTHLDIHWHHAALTLCSISELLSVCKWKDVTSDNNPLDTQNKFDNGMWSLRTICNVRKEAVDMYNVQNDRWICGIQYCEFSPKRLMIPECVCSHGVSLKTLLSSLHSPSINIINMLQLTDMVMPPQWRAWRSLSYFFFSLWKTINVYPVLETLLFLPPRFACF